MRPRRPRSNLTHLSPPPFRTTSTPHFPRRQTSTTSTPTTPCSSRPHAIITGASRGIGLSISHLLAKQGYTLTLIARDPTRLTTAASTLAHATRHQIVAGDVSSAAFWRDLRLEAAAAAAAGPPADKGRRRVEALVNAAGMGQQSLFLRTSEERVEEMLRTNLLGTMWGARWAGRRMMRQGPASRDAPRHHHQAGTEGDQGAVGGRGVIVNVASLLAVHAGLGSAVYAASKAGVLGFSRALAAELGPSGIRIIHVNTVLPGYVSTDMTDAMTPEAREQALSRIPLKRFGTADEVANAVLFLLTNGYAHNCVLNLDGGLSATVSLLGNS